MDKLMLFSHLADVCKQTFLGFVPWNYYLDTGGPQCAITNFNFLGANSGLLLILLAVLDDLFRAVGIIAVAFIIYSGARYVLANGDPNEAAKAQGGIISALIGIAIALFATITVRFIGNQAGTGTAGSSGNIIDLSGLPNPIGAADGGFLQTVLTLAFGLLGATAFLIIVIGGFQYVLSQGDPQQTTKAKNMIVYALIGLVVAILAQSIVSFVVNHR